MKGEDRNNGRVARELLAYIYSEGSESVLIDIIAVTKKGLSYRYDGEVWNRMPPYGLNTICRNPRGRLMRIMPLQRHFGPPRWVAGREVTVAARASTRYERWLVAETSHQS